MWYWYPPLQSSQPKDLWAEQLVVEFTVQTEPKINLAHFYNLTEHFGWTDSLANKQHFFQFLPILGRSIWAFMILAILATLPIRSEWELTLLEPDPESVASENNIIALFSAIRTSLHLDEIGITTACPMPINSSISFGLKLTTASENVNC